MPIYTFYHSKSGNYRDISLGMNEIKVYNGEDNSETGEWERVFHVPNTSIDTRCDPYSSKDFIKATNKKGSIGDLIDRSGELSEKRGGTFSDPIKKEFYKNWSKRRRGKLHPEIRKEKNKERLNKFSKKYGVKIINDE